MRSLVAVLLAVFAPARALAPSDSCTNAPNVREHNEPADLEAALVLGAAT
jgi:hypothetical protein